MSKEFRGGTRFYIVRHAESYPGENGSIAGGKTDTTLTAEGHKQATLLPERFAQIKIDAIFSSDMIRTRATVEPLAKQRDIKVVAHPALRERVYGDEFENQQSKEKAESAKNKLYNFWYMDHEDRKNERLGQNMETDQELMDKVIPFFQETASEHPNETILFATHCDVMSTFLQTAITAKDQLYYPDHTGQAIVDFANNSFELRGMQKIPRLR